MASPHEEQFNQKKAKVENLTTLTIPQGETIVVVVRALYPGHVRGNTRRYLNRIVFSGRLLTPGVNHSVMETESLQQPIERLTSCIRKNPKGRISESLVTILYRRNHTVMAVLIIITSDEKMRIGDINGQDEAGFTEYIRKKQVENAVVQHPSPSEPTDIPNQIRGLAD